jgi:hypothetical protein
MRAVVWIAITCLLCLSGFAANYDDLLKQGYRWVTVDGPYACASVEDLRKITAESRDELELKFVRELKAYYLIEGTMVQVIQEDKSEGVSQIRIDGITKPLWTRNAYLTTHPSKSVIGRLELPGRPAETPAINAPPGEAASPGGSPTSQGGILSPAASPTPSSTP